jgi:hypothetical protein
MLLALSIFHATAAIALAIPTRRDIFAAEHFHATAPRVKHFPPDPNMNRDRSGD